MIDLKKMENNLINQSNNYSYIKNMNKKIDNEFNTKKFKLIERNDNKYIYLLLIILFFILFLGCKKK